MTISSENEFFFVMYAFGRHENVFHKKWVATDCILLFLEYYSADVIRFCRTHFEFFRFIQLIVIGFDFSSACESILCCHVIVDWKWFYWKISFYEGGRRGGGGWGVLESMNARTILYLSSGHQVVFFWCAQTSTIFSYLSRAIQHPKLRSVMLEKYGGRRVTCW